MRAIPTTRPVTSGDTIGTRTCENPYRVVSLITRYWLKGPPVFGRLQKGISLPRSYRKLVPIRLAEDSARDHRKRKDEPRRLIP